MNHNSKKFEDLKIKNRWLWKSKEDAAARKYSSEAALSLRVRLRGTKFAVSLLAKLLIKCRRLPRGFFWNTSLPPLICWLFYFWKSEYYDKLWNLSGKVCKSNLSADVFQEAFLGIVSCDKLVFCFSMNNSIVLWLMKENCIKTSISLLVDSAKIYIFMSTKSKDLACSNFQISLHKIALIRWFFQKTNCRGIKKKIVKIERWC